MWCHRLQRWLTVGVMLALPAMAYAQEATLSGSVDDTTGGALPGVTVRAVHEASGNSFEAVTDERGAYRLPLRVGAYRVTGELAGFAPVTRTLTLLVGQQAVVNLQLAVSGVQESVTVTGEAPLLDVTGSSLGGNIDPRQVQELPVQGRGWTDLALLAPGARGNALASDLPTAFGGGRSRAGGEVGLNVDGQQVTNLLTAFEGLRQPRISKDAIAEFEFISSRFDASQGRSSGTQINAVTKSGTNTPAGTFAGYFRHDRFNAADHVARRVLPYQNQQISGTFGGPIRRDKVHFFANYEYEREPRVILYTTPYPHFNRDLSTNNTQKLGGGRLDAQFSARTRLAVRGNAWKTTTTGGGGGSSTPSSATKGHNAAPQLTATLAQVFGNRAVNEVKGGYAGWEEETNTILTNPSARFGVNAPTVLLQGLSAGGSNQNPQVQNQDSYSVRDDFTYSFTKAGRHTWKMGAEYLRMNAVDLRCIPCEGELEATGGPIPVPVETIFPNLFDVSTWNLAPLSPVSVRWRQVFGESFTVEIPRYSFAGWVQDDWTLSPRLTLNLGLRYDLELNAFANDVKMLPFLTGDQPNDTNNVGPRLGFSFSLNDRTVMRGGYGKYFGTVVTAYYAKHVRDTAIITTRNDGRPDFASNPYNGPAPTFASVTPNFCTTALVPGCLRRDFPTGTATIYGPDFTMPYSHQPSIGVQRQLGNTMAIEADYVYIGTRNTPRAVLMNLSYNPATGVNYPLSDISKRPYPEWGFVKMFFNGSRGNQHALQTAFTKRFSSGWQAAGTYTLSTLRDAGPPARVGLEPVPFEVAPDLGSQYTVSAGDQRHRAVFNGIWQLGYGFQLSGLYFFGSGEHLETRYGLDLRGIGTTSGQSCECRLRPDGTIVPRNSFVGKAIHRVDLRVQRRFPLGGRAGIDGILETFNLFNRANFGSYVTDEVSRNYGQPQQHRSVAAYGPRILQLGFRFAF